MSRMGDTLGGLGDMFFGRREEPKIPEAKTPAAPAPARRDDTGAQIVVGSSAAKDQRVSGGSGGSSSAGKDVLGNLGRGGLSI